MKNSAFYKQLSLEFKAMFFTLSIFIILAIAPIFYGPFYALPYKAEIVRKIPIVVVDYDKTPLSKKLSQMINDSENVEVASYPTDFEEAKNFFYMRKAFSVVVIPKDFAKNIYRGEQAKISLFTDGSYILYYKQSYSSIQQAVATLGAGMTIQRLQAATKSPASFYTSIAFNNQALYNPSGGYATYVLPAVFVLICHQLMLIAMGMTMAYERKNNMYAVDLNTTTPITPLTRLGAKVYINFAVMTIQALFLFGVVLPALKVTFIGTYSNAILFLFPFFLSVIFMGIIIGSFFKIQETVILYIVVTSIPLLFLSGVPWSKASMPLLIQWFSDIFPSTHGITGFVKIYREGASLKDVLPSLSALWLTSVVLFPIAWWRMTVLSKKYGGDK